MTRPQHEWAWSKPHAEPCRVIETESTWGDTVYRVWLARSEAVVRVSSDDLLLEPQQWPKTIAAVVHAAAAARVVDALAQDVLLAPAGISVIPLPHQLHALARATERNRVRFLLADEVGLGKTIEAGLILRELKLRGLLKRVLIVVPKGLIHQWVAEMRTHFGEELRHLSPANFAALREVTGDTNPWRLHPQVITSMDSVKPLEKRRGWSSDQIARMNRERFEDMITAGWDLVVVDEAHRLGGSSTEVARVKLGRGLAEAAPYLLLLSATPHSGKSDSFQRLLALLDADAFPDGAPVRKDQVSAFVIRTEKRRAIDAEGRPLFQPRQTKLVSVDWQSRHAGQQSLYEAVSEYVRVGYNQAMREKRAYVGFLLLLLQRLVTSSTRAIRTTLERRLEALKAPEDQLSLWPSEEDWNELTGEEQVETLLKTRLKALRNERAEVELLLEACHRVEAVSSDAKAEALLHWIYDLQQSENDPELKVLIFTEFVPTQQMLAEFLTSRGFTVARLNGGMDLDARGAVQRAFAGDTRILISTDAGGEGLNLQFCHIVVNYDIPWNPMRVEQRIGRVDRIGQKRTVRALNFVLAETVEHRVREVLEDKLAVILDEFGVDKIGDVLDSPELFEDLYVDAIQEPAAAETKAEKAMSKVRAQAEQNKMHCELLRSEYIPDASAARAVLDHPMTHWVERATVEYLKMSGGSAVRQGTRWHLRWPDGSQVANAVFLPKDADADPTVQQLTLEDSRVRRAVEELPRFVECEAVTRIRVPALPGGVRGYWSLWLVTLSAVDWRQRRVVPLFVDEDGRELPSTARLVWDRLLSGEPELHGTAETMDPAAFEKMKGAAERQAEPVYRELLRFHRAAMVREREKAQYGFAVRRSMISRIGLANVRQHRLAKLEAEENEWRESMGRRESVMPELVPVSIVHVS